MNSNKNEKWDLWDGMFIAKGDICFHWASSSFHLYLPTNSKRSAMAKYNVQTFPVQLCRYALPIKWKNQHMKKKQRSPTDFWWHKKHILTIMIFRLFVQIFCVCVLIPLFCSVLCVFFYYSPSSIFRTLNRQLDNSEDPKKSNAEVIKISEFDKTKEKTHNMFAFISNRETIKKNMNLYLMCVCFFLFCFMIFVLIVDFWFDSK